MSEPDRSRITRNRGRQRRRPRRLPISGPPAVQSDRHPLPAANGWQPRCSRFFGHFRRRKARRGCRRALRRCGRLAYNGRSLSYWAVDCRPPDPVCRGGRGLRIAMKKPGPFSTIAERCRPGCRCSRRRSSASGWRGGKSSCRPSRRWKRVDADRRLRPPQAEPGAALSGQVAGAARPDTARGLCPGPRSRSPKPEYAALRRATLGGMAMHHRSIAEMQTGEGKTLTATLPLYLAAGGQGRPAGHGERLPGPPRRRVDAAVYECLGMSVGIIESQMPQNRRREGLCLRHHLRHGQGIRLRLPSRQIADRRIGEGQTDFLGGMLGTNGDSAATSLCSGRRSFMLVDEADSILIDEARTPLIISALPTEAAADRGRVVQVERVGRRAVRRGRALRLRPRQENGRADRRRPPPGPRTGQARRHALGGHVHTFTNTSSGQSAWIASSSSTGSTW